MGECDIDWALHQWGSYFCWDFIMGR